MTSFLLINSTGFWCDHDSVGPRLPSSSSTGESFALGALMLDLTCPSSNCCEMGQFSGYQGQLGKTSPVS